MYEFIYLLLGSLVCLAFLAFVGRVVYNGKWKLSKTTKHTWTTKAGKGTTFVSKSRILLPGELSSRQKKMREPSYRWLIVLLLVVFLVSCWLVTPL